MDNICHKSDSRLIFDKHEYIYYLEKKSRYFAGVKLLNLGKQKIWEMYSHIFKSVTQSFLAGKFIADELCHRCFLLCCPRDQMIQAYHKIGIL